jgi:KDO2-lipid IV(A) lauroyltransferase
MAKSTFQIYAEYIPVRLLILFLQLLPLPVMRFFARCLGTLVYVLVSSVRKVSRINLDIVYGEEKTGKEKNRIAYRSCRNIVQTFVEVMILGKYSAGYVIKKTAAPTFNRFEKVYSKDKGAIVVSIHNANWYWPAVYGGAIGYHTYAVDRPLDNPLLDKLMNDMLHKRNMSLIHRGNAIKGCTRVLRNKGITAIVIDQNSATGGLFVPWFGVLASTMAGVSFLHRLTGAPVICVHDKRLSNGRHEMIFSDEITMGKDDADNMRQLHAYFEPIIKADPEQYFWMHPRWKKQPDDEKNYYQGLHV